MRLSEAKNEDAIELIADLIEPASEIFSDKEVAQAGRDNNKAKAVKIALKNHSKAVVEILARLDGVEVNDYNKNVIEMTVELLNLLNDKELIEVFQSQGQEQTLFGSATENTEADEK